MEPEKDLTHLIRRVRDGDLAAAAELLPRIYDELHDLARRQMRGQDKNHTLQTTDLVGEVYVKLFGGKSGQVQDRRHFMMLAARAIRSILVDHARAKGRLKRSPVGARVVLDGLAEDFEERAQDLVALDEALDQLGGFDPDLLRLVELRFFVGLSVDETAGVLGISPRQAAREWNTAKAWLRKAIQ